MTPAARIQAAIELLDEILTADAPADLAVGRYTRTRRYMGSKDRRAVVERVYGTLRRRARLSWWCEQAADGPVSENGRRLILAALTLNEDAADLREIFNGAPYHPAPLDESELALVAVLNEQTLNDPAQDTATRLELPAWLEPCLRAAFGADLETEVSALNGEAPLDLRVNSLKSDREAARAALAEACIQAAPIPFLPDGLRVEGRRAVRNTAAFIAGSIEVQDAGSQVVALLCDARPDMAVADFCAGAGGKTLALAAAMENRGRLVALDVDQARLDRSAARLRRAGVSLVERQVLEGEGWLKDNAGRFDRVLVDAPCSGCGAWRRDPHARWRMTPESLARAQDAQTGSLRKAADLVRPGGRLIYATCSLLPEENEMQVEAFLRDHSEFTVRPAQVWKETLGAMGAAPPNLAPFQGDYLFLTPARHGTDGFFAAVLERTAGSGSPQ